MVSRGLRQRGKVAWGCWGGEEVNGTRLVLTFWLRLRLDILQPCTCSDVVGSMSPRRGRHLLLHPGGASVLRERHAVCPREANALVEVHGLGDVLACSHEACQVDGGSHAPRQPCTIGAVLGIGTASGA